MFAKKTTSHDPTSLVAIGALLLLSTLSACQESGGRAKTPGTVGPPSGPVLAIDFGLRRDFSLGSAFIGDVLHLDLNGDGIEDLVETNYLPMQVNFAFGNPDGSFTQVTARSTAGHAWRLATGDFDGNGLADLAVVSQEYRGTGIPAVELFLQGPSAGEFTLPVVRRTVDKDPIDMAVAPITGMAGDPGPDELFVAIRGERRVARLSLAGNALEETGSLESSNVGAAGGPFSIAVIDLGADGALDLVVGEELVPGQPDRVVHYARNGGGFDPAQLVMSPLYGPIVDNTGDMDGNGFEDVAVAQLYSDDVYLLQGDAGGLSMATSLDFGARTTSLLFPDLDGDGLAEAVATTLLDGSIQILPGTGPMAWGDPIHYNVGPIPRAIDTILLPGDDIPDLLCANARDLSVMVGLGGGMFRAAMGFDSTTEGVSIVELGDLDNDGDLDAVSVSRAQQSITFYRGNGNGKLRAVTVLPLTPTTDDELGHVAMGDMDGDGDLDVLTSVRALDEIRLYRNPTVIDDFQDPPISDVFPTEGGPEGFCICDMNGDTRPDVVVANETAGTVQVFLNAGGGELDPQPGLPVGVAPSGPVAMDFDGDGDMDIAVFAQDVPGYSVLILSGDGQGGLALDESHQVDGPSDSMVTGDFNEDGMPDLVVGQTGAAGDALFVLVNQAGLSFDARRIIVAEGPGAVMVADLNNDLHLDIAVGTSLGELYVLLGDGLGGFPSIVPGGPGELPIAHNTVSAKLGDLDGDELLDLVHCSALTPFVWVGLNESTPVSQP